MMKRHAFPMTSMMILASVASAQEFTLDWHSVDGGGGFSAGSGFELVGALGQPDAGPVLSGGDFTLEGGFLAGLASESGDSCNGNEKIKKAKCKIKNGAVKKMIASVTGGTPNTVYTATLETGQSLDKPTNDNGKVKFVFKGADAPPCGPNHVTVCDQSKAFDCAC